MKKISGDLQLLQNTPDDFHGEASSGEKSGDRLKFFDFRPVFFGFQRTPFDFCRFGGPFVVSFFRPPVLFHGFLDDVLRNAFVFQLEDGLEAADAGRFEVVDVVCGELRVIQQPGLQQVVDDGLDILCGEFAGVEELPFEARHGMRAVLQEAEGFFTASFKGVGGHAGEKRLCWGQNKGNGINA